MPTLMNKLRINMHKVQPIQISGSAITVAGHLTLRRWPAMRTFARKCSLRKEKCSTLHNKEWLIGTKHS